MKSYPILSPLTALITAVLLMAGCLSSSLADQYSSAINKLNPVLYFRFDGNLDNSATGPNAVVLKSTPKWIPSYVAGPSGGSYKGFQSDNRSISGISDIQKLLLIDSEGSTVNTALNGATGLTFSVWVNLSSDLKNSWYLVNGVGSNTTYVFGLTPTGVSLGGRSNSEETYSCINRDYKLSPGTWYNVVGVLDFTNGKMAVYANGSLIGVVGSASWGRDKLSVSTDMGGVAFGTSYAGSGYSGAGVVDEIVVYKCALSDTQIAGLYRAATALEAQ